MLRPLYFCRLVPHLAAVVTFASCATPSIQDEPLASVSQADTAASDCSALNDVALGNPAVFFSPFDAPESKALCVLASAKSEVLIAHYNIRSRRMLDALVELKNRGVIVRVAVDRDNAAEDYNTGDDFLESQGIPVVRVKPQGQYSIMHLKVAVVDSERVMTGSFNWNNTAALANDENMLVFRDPDLALKYRNEVLEVLGDRPHVNEGGAVGCGMEVHFAPETRLDSVIRREIDAAKQSVDVAMFTFTMQNIADALRRAVTRGVRVRMVVEQKQTDLSDAEDRVESVGATVIRGANKMGAHAAMHQKYAIIDGHRVLSGATNWTASGTRYNEEDLLIIDSPSLALRYRQNFADLLWIYGGLETSDSDPALLGDQATVVFQIVNGTTEWGDRSVVVGNHPSLGNWNPFEGVDAQTEDIFPIWAAHATVPAGTRLEYKFATIKRWGEVRWEGGGNRVVDVPKTGRSSVIGGMYGNTMSNWTPRTAQ